MPRQTDAWLLELARALRDVEQRFVFLGGAVLGLLLDDAAAPARPTDDVDIAIDAATPAGYYAFTAELARRGFRVDAREGAPICRWRRGELVIDVMPAAGEILGFTNRWYAGAIAHAAPVELEAGLIVNLVTAPYFLATKFEAFDGRGHADYQASHDLEDVIAVIAGRDHVVDEVARAPAEARSFIATAVGALLATRAFLDALPGHLAGDDLRLPIVRARLTAIAAMR